MKRMTILLSAATLALVPLMSAAKGNPKEPLITPTELQIFEDQITCSCSDPGEPELVGDVMATPITCTAQWTDVIGGLPDKATYGASFEVEVLDEATEDEQVDALMAELEGDWNTLCLDGTCVVPPTTFYLTYFDNGTDQIEVHAAVKAFYNGKDGSKPRNFKKTRSAEACYTNVPADPGV